MPMVDPYDDSITRYVVHRYAYDATRHERRHITVATFDNAAEFRATIDALTREIQSRRNSGEDVDPREHVTGTVKSPGRDRQRRFVRMAINAVRHGVSPPDWLIAEVQGVPGVQFVRFRHDDTN